MRQHEEISPADVLWYMDMMICGKLIWLRCVHTHDSMKVIITYSAIGALSKYAWVVPLKTKNGFEVAKAFAKVIRDRCPKNFQTDQEKKFYNADVQRSLKKHNINQYSTYSVMKASIEERFNRTLKHHIWKLFVLIGIYRWIDALPNLVAEYNIRKHRTIRMRPCGVALTIAGKLLNTVYSHIQIAASPRFKVGVSVRVSKYKTITNPVTYLLQDSCGKPIAGGFYEHELQRVINPDVYLVEKVLRKEDDKVHVKWLRMFLQQR
ncbi:uncharacterized protein LOC143187592 [Calliopsis andreniformis]|uniref:uncharacterized protein LOC143187592 n=1 Tax=Calliopsis andreniformis TaxID=337506 RepID=UPI003FCCEA66